MTKEETIEAIKVMQAYVDGQGIEVNYGGKWEGVEPGWNWDNNVNEYRIKSEPHLRPYKDMKEFVKALREHDGWLQHKEESFVTTPIFADNSSVDVIGGAGPIDDYGYERFSFYELLDRFTWIDGSPCGVKEE